jgi:hypothetical protein
MRRKLGCLTENGQQPLSPLSADDKRGTGDMRSKPGKKKRQKLSLKKAAKALAKLISRQEDKREQNIAQFERELAKKLKRLRQRRPKG